MNRRRLLISAYGCEPAKGSEQGVGWNWALQASRMADIIVVTRTNNREAIEASLPYDLSDRIRFVYHDLPDRLRAFKRGGRGLYLYYILWQWGAYKKMRRYVATEPVDYVMHLTFGSIWMPTFMHRLPAPFIWGPVGGGEAVPWSLIRTLPLRGRIMEYARYFLMATFTINPLVSGVARRARVILARTDDTARVFPAAYHYKLRQVLETAATETWFRHQPRGTSADKDALLQVIYTGRLVPLKNLEMAIRAIGVARRRGVNLHFSIVGDGPLKSALAKVARDEGVADVITFTGRCTQKEVLDKLVASDVYLFPSLKEGGVWSLMEAMAVGLPSVCVNTSGMKVIADDKCAKLIKPAPPAAMVKSFADALCDLAGNAELRREMGINGRARLQNNFCWSQKGVFLGQVLDDLDRGTL